MTASKELDSKDLFERASQLRSQGDYDAAINILKNLLDSGTNNSKVWAALGDAYWESGKLGHAIKSFQCAIAIEPTWLLASLGLFHCLWESGDKDAALNEIRRFMSISDSMEYRQILSDITSS